MRDRRSQLEELRYAYTAVMALILLLTLFAVSLALVVFGSTRGRLIGLPMLALSVFIAGRAMRDRAG